MSSQLPSLCVSSQEVPNAQTIKRWCIAFTVGLLMFCPIHELSADWDPGDPFKMHFPQLPDLTPDGLDVLASPAIHDFLPVPDVSEKFLADDWLCTESGPVTGIHIWGSYLFDQQLLPSLDPNDSFFSIASGMS